MHPLIDQLTASRSGRLGSPLAIVAGATAVAVAPAQVKQLAMDTRGDLFGETLQSRVEAVVEAHLHAPIRPPLEHDQPLDLRRRRARPASRRARARRRPGPARSARPARRGSPPPPLRPARAPAAPRLSRRRPSGARRRRPARTRRSGRSSRRVRHRPAEPMARLPPIKSATDDPDAQRATTHVLSLANAPVNSKSNANSDAPAAAIA